MKLVEAGAVTSEKRHAILHRLDEAREVVSIHGSRDLARRLRLFNTVPQPYQGRVPRRCYELAQLRVPLRADR
jgi:hypothetical protein